MKDEIFLLCETHRQGDCISVYGRNSMTEKDVIWLPGLRTYSITACNVSKCVYILCREIRHKFSIWRIVKEDDHWSTASLVICDMYLPCPTMHMTANGRFAFSRKLCKTYTPIITCDANGAMQREVQPSTDISSLWYLAPKSNGNLVLLTAKLLEINMHGVVLRQHLTTYMYQVIGQADNNGRVLLTDRFNRMELVDSECNYLKDFTNKLLQGGQFVSPSELYFNCERNEIIAIIGEKNSHGRLLCILQLTEI